MIMKSFIDPGLAAYFFGSEFKLDVVEKTLNRTAEGRALVKKLIETTKRDELHFGLQLVCYRDLDSGLFLSILQKSGNAPSMISFYISSNHPYFGGQTLLCVPFQFCTLVTSIEGEYLVYRHTFKEPVISAEEYKKIMASGSYQQKLNIFGLLRSRDGYRTIPGMSYVGMTKRNWQQRYIEHIESALSGSSSTLFHQAIREMEGKKIVCVHDVTAFGITEAAAKEYEKDLIRNSTLSPKGLNMKVG